MSIPKTALPIIDYSYSEAADMISVDEIPLCPHCKEWSYYTPDEAEQRGGYTICPFCQGEMYMPSSPHDYNVEYEGDKIIRVDFLQDKQSEDVIDTQGKQTEDVIDTQCKRSEDIIGTQGKQTEVYRFADCGYCDGKHCIIEEILNGTRKSPSLASYFK